MFRMTMANRIFLIYGLVIIAGLCTALGNGWELSIPAGSPGDTGARGSSGFFRWGGGK